MDNDENTMLVQTNNPYRCRVGRGTENEKICRVAGPSQTADTHQRGRWFADDAEAGSVSGKVDGGR